MKDINKRLSELEHRAKPIERVTLHYADGTTERMTIPDAIMAILKSQSLDCFADEFPVDDKTIPRIVGITETQHNLINAILGHDDPLKGDE